MLKDKPFGHPDYQPKMRCNRCRGSGDAPCQICNGSGQRLTGYDQYHRPVHDRCTGCMGRRSMRCTTCGGEGFV